MKRREWMKLTLASAAVAVTPAVVPAGITAASTPSPPPVPDGRMTAPLPVPASDTIKVAFLISPDAEVVDFAGPWGVFEYVLMGDEQISPFTLFTVAAGREPVRVSGGLTIVPDYSFGDAPAPDVVVVPAMDTGKLDPAALAWLKSVQAEAEVTMSVCNGSFVMAEAGLLDGKSATAHHGSYGMLRALYPRVKVVRGMRYVEDGRLATAGGLTSGMDLALRVVERYFGRDVALQTATNLEYQGKGWMNPASNGEFAKKPVGTAERPVCPVCEAQISRKTALTWEYRGVTYYFCSNWCRDQFVADPLRFIEAT